LEDLAKTNYVSVVLPTYNEAGTIVGVVQDVLDELGMVEVIVVDDDSPDETWRIALEAFGGDDRVRVVRRVNNHGLSSAVLDGFRKARGQICVCMDADGQHPAERIVDLIDQIVLGSDLVVGSRHVGGGEIDGWSWSRKIKSKIATLLSRTFVAPARMISDPMSGFFAVDRQVFDDDVLDAADPHGYKILLELANQVPEADIFEVPITFRARRAGESKLTLDEQIRFIEHIVGLWFSNIGFNNYVTTPIFLRSVEAGFVVAFAFLLMNAGLILGNVDGAVGAGLIAASGGAIVLGAQRLARTGESWTANQRSSGEEVEEVG